MTRLEYAAKLKNYDLDTIPLTQGHEAIIDEADSELRQYRWRYSGGYAKRTGGKPDGDQKGISIYLHRTIWKKHTGAIPENLMIDHVDRDPLNNRLENLRVVNALQNTWNQLTVKHTGVNFLPRDKLFQAVIQYKGTGIHLGTDKNQYKMIAFRNYAIKMLFGEYAALIEVSPNRKYILSIDEILLINDRIQRKLNRPSVIIANNYHPKSVLDWDKIRKIRAEYVPRKVSMAKLAVKFCVTQLTIFHIVHNKSWKVENMSVQS